MSDLTSKQAAIDAIERTKTARSPDGEIYVAKINAQMNIQALPSVETERLTDDDFETIRIHLNAYKEKLCNQRRWEEAEEYQRIIDRFMAFASAEPERDIPLKPIADFDRSWGIPRRQAVCPKCDYFLGNWAFLGDGKRITYCETCGQAIDWEGWENETD